MLDESRINLSDPAVQKRLAAQWGYALAEPAGEPEPVAWRHGSGRHLSFNPNNLPHEQLLSTGWVPLFAHPLQRDD